MYCNELYIFSGISLTYHIQCVTFTHISRINHIAAAQCHLHMVAQVLTASFHRVEHELHLG